jgi:F-type H+-transporting ATPase subunit delta
MVEVKISKRYAKGLFDFAKESNKLDEIYSEINSVSVVLQENKEIKILLASPILDDKKKSALLTSLFGGLSKDTLNFLLLLNKNRRANLMEEIANQFSHLYNFSIEKYIAHLTLAEDLDDDILTQILEIGKKKLSIHNNVELKKTIDRSIIGGFVLRIKDKQLDASVKNRIIDLKSKFDTKLYESHL